MFDYSVLFSSLPFLFEHLRKAQFQLGVESYLRVEQVLVQLAMQGKLSSEFSELKQQLFNYLRPLLCHSPVEQQLFSKHFEEWWSTFIQIPELSSAQEIQIKQVKKITRFGILVLLLVCAIVGAGHWHFDRILEIFANTPVEKKLKEEIKKLPENIAPIEEISPQSPTSEDKKPIEQQQPDTKKEIQKEEIKKLPETVAPIKEISPQLPVSEDKKLIQQQQPNFQEPPNTFQNLAFSNSPYVALSFAGLLAILLFYLLFLRWRTQQFLNRYAVTQQFATQTVYVQEVQQRLFQSVEFGQTAQQLRVHELVETNDLDDGNH